MKKILFSTFLFTVSILCTAQQTFVPDDNFEQALIDLGYDDILDNFVLTSNINSVTDLDVTWKNISDLTGIEGFSSLTFLNVGFNQLTSLDLNQNTSLQHLFCEVNQLTDLNVSQNSFLIDLYCRGNQLTNVDLTHNTILQSLKIPSNQLQNMDLSNNILLRHLDVGNNELTDLNLNGNTGLREFFCQENNLAHLDVSNNTQIYHMVCGSNQLTELDLSHNINLIFFSCENNAPLSNLNVKNGNNTNVLNFVTTDNPELACIQVDNAEWSEENWTNVDSWTNFSENCMMSNTEIELTQFQLYPNPAHGIINFPEPVWEISIYDLSGRLIKSQPKLTDKLDISFLPAGNYIIKGTTKTGNKFSEKIIKISSNF